MKHLVDANVLSEPTKPDPDGRVVSWLRHHERSLVVDPIILGEIEYGILLLSAGKRRQRLEQWFAGGIRRMICLPWDSATGMRWAQLLATLSAKGKTMPIKDSLIAATALVHNLVVVTRNTKDFRKADVQVINPFE